MPCEFCLIPLLFTSFKVTRFVCCFCFAKVTQCYFSLCSKLRFDRFLTYNILNRDCLRGPFVLRIPNTNANFILKFLTFFTHPIMRLASQLGCIKKAKHCVLSFCILSDPGGTQTPNPQSRNLIFYSIELRGLILWCENSKLLLVCGSIIKILLK